MISKELLSEILKVGIHTIDGNSYIVGGSDTLLHYTTLPSINIPKNINIYELAHKCKEKAGEYGYTITTGNRVDDTDRYDVLCIHKDEDVECGEAVFFNRIVDTEPDGCFLAMQWILDNRVSK